MQYYDFVSYNKCIVNVTKATRSRHMLQVVLVTAITTLTRCKSTVFMMEPWKKVTVVK